MCFSSAPKIPDPPKPKPPPPPPPAPEEPPQPAALNETSTEQTNEQAAQRVGRRGTASLRINLNVNSAGRTGLNVPR